MDFIQMVKSVIDANLNAKLVKAMIYVWFVLITTITLQIVLMMIHNAL